MRYPVKIVLVGGAVDLEVPSMLLDVIAQSLHVVCSQQALEVRVGRDCSSSQASNEQGTNDAHCGFRILFQIGDGEMAKIAVAGTQASQTSKEKQKNRNFFVCLFV